MPGPDPVWLVEPGIGETRAVLLADGAIRAARLCWHEPWRAGAVTMARLDHRHPGSARGAVVLPDGTIAAIDGLPAGLAHGARLMVRITRAALAEAGRFKLAQCRPAPDAAEAPAPPLAEVLAQGAVPVEVLDRFSDRLDRAGWDDVIEQARSGLAAFAGGTLTISPTPAMTLVDVDGAPPLLPLALAAARAVPLALARLDVAGSVAIDFPGLDNKAARQEVDRALDLALATAGWQGERTAMNGFGLVQLVSRLERPSLLARFRFHRARAEALALLRRAERVTGPGALLVAANRAVLAAIEPAWWDDLARRSGRTVRRELRESLADHAGFAQAITP